jgi:hypothetical protein
VALKNSPLNEGKKALAKAQAGQYDEAAVRSKINGMIADNAVGVGIWQPYAHCSAASPTMRSSWTKPAAPPTQSSVKAAASSVI